MSEKIERALQHHFGKYRLIFWYDDGGEMRDDFNTFNELGISKVEIDNNEFYIRYKIRKLEPDQKFLVYSAAPKPDDKENWLLDLNLEGFVFASDKSSLIVQELDLDQVFLPLIQGRIAFFGNKKERLEPLKKILNNEEDEDSLQIAMLSVLSGSTKDERESRKEFPEIVLNLFFNSFLDGDGSNFKNIEKYSLSSFFWDKVESEWGYRNPENSLEGLLNYILQSAFEFQLKESTGKGHLLIFTLVDEWRNNMKYGSRFRDLLGKREKELNIKYALEKETSLEVLVAVDLFKEADRQVLYRILADLKNGRIDFITALHFIEKRRETYWYKSDSTSRLAFHYKALYFYLQFKELRKRIDLDFKDTMEGWRLYAKDYYKLDTLYRKFHHAYQESGSPGEFKVHLEDLEKEYTEGYLIPLSNTWQKAIDKDPGLDSLAEREMRYFFKRYVVPYLKQDRYLFVVISDGFRYELGAELAEDLAGKNRFQVNLESVKAPVPSYTQLGMATLLPYNRMQLDSDGNTVLIDGKKTQGWASREKILQSYLDAEFPGKKARILSAKDLFELPLSIQEEEIKGIDLVYLHSPGVDAVGENTKTEGALFTSAGKEIEFISDLARKIVNLNRTHILITADHGFLYRYKPVPEVDWMQIERGEGEVKRDHRFIVAENPVPHTGTDILEPEKLGWSGPFKVQVARGIGRIKRPGGGSRFVHGSRSLQELAVPLLILKKSRKDDVSFVEIAVVDRKNVITTGQVSVKFIQEEPVDIKTKAREVFARFESRDGKELSSSKTLIFDSTEGNDQNRTRIESFLFNRHAEEYNEATIYLRLYDIKAGGTKVFYKEFSYRFRKNIQSDFDF